MEVEIAARSLLFTPANQPDRYSKALNSGADIVTIDLEDSVAPAEKNKARAEALPWFSKPRLAGQVRALRINDLQTEHGLKDILAIRETQAQPDLIILPKVESPAHLEQLDDLLQGSLAGIRFVALIETAKGLSSLDSIIWSTDRVVAILFGAADMSTSLRCANAWDSLLYARSTIIKAAAEANIEVLDSPFFDLNDGSAFITEINRAVEFGFTGKAAIHPKQIASINVAFSPSLREIEEAEKILAENTKGVGLVNGRMVDEALAKRARRLLALSYRPRVKRTGEAEENLR